VQLILISSAINTQNQTYIKYFLSPFRKHWLYVSRVRQYDGRMIAKDLNLPPWFLVPWFLVPLRQNKREQSIKIIPLLAYLPHYPSCVGSHHCTLCFMWLYAYCFCYMDFLGIGKIAKFIFSLLP
jgi:hypothetical protein